MKKKYFYLNLSDFLVFFSAIFHRTKTIENYFHFQAIQGKMLKKFLDFQKICLKDYLVLDLANGYGGETTIFDKYCKQVIGLDLTFPKRNFSFPQIVANALTSPFANESFDLIICASLIEHVHNPKELLFEIDRLLKAEGVVYISFPPFYSPLGAHNFSPFHYFGERINLQIYKFIVKNFLKKEFLWGNTIPTSYSNAYGRSGLNKMTIKTVKKLIKDSNFEIIDQSTKWFPINLSRIPIINELLTWHIQFLLRKTS